MKNKVVPDLAEGWNAKERPTHNLAELQELLDRFTTNTDELSEITMDAERPVVIRRAETNGMMVELSAGVKSGTYGAPDRLTDTKSKSKKSPTERLRSIFDSMEGPAVTTEEVARELGCSPDEALHHLIELDHRGWINHRASGSATLWWPCDSSNQTSEIQESGELPEFVEKGLKKSHQDIQEWIKNNQKPGESDEETYERIRGSPTFDEVKKMIGGSDSSMSEALTAAKERKRDSEKKKDDLKNMFG